MKRAALVIAFGAVGLVTPACGLFSAAHPAVLVATAPASAPILAKPVAHQDEVAPADPRKVGDYYVHRFSGSYEKSPLTLTEEIVAQEEGLWVIDYTFEQPSSTTKLRVRLDPKTDSVVRVSKLDGTNESKVPLATYERLMERTSFTADANDGMVAAEHGTCVVGPSELDCETKSYKVWVGDKAATLSVSHSDSVPDRDVSGDITSSDGTLIYRSELVEMGTAGSARPGVASR
ncbi:MAG TPA: hypothetical protein VNW92_09220 [Polyangiaceae bacterium]|nr:hypothetical protein [Polyangiaceae bacterium]